MKPPASKSGLLIKLRWLLLGSFTLVFTIVLTAIFYWFYTFATQQAMNQVEEDLFQVISVVAFDVDGDELLALSEEGQPNAAGLAWHAAKENAEAKKAALTQFGSPNAAGFSDDPRYRRLLDWLEAVHEIEPRAWPYLWVNTEMENEVIYVVDLAARYSPDESTLFLEHDTESGVATELSMSMDEEGNLESYKDPWGEWYSAWLPVRTANGELVGGIGVDFKAGEVDQIQQKIRQTVLIAFGFTYLALFLAAFWVARIITQPIVGLTGAAEAVGEGNYEQDFSKLYGKRFFYNEIDIMARVFDIMVAKVHQREEKLKQQVTELRIEVDEVKRQTQVTEIVDTDFFRELQEKARNMRSRREKPASDDEK